MLLICCQSENGSEDEELFTGELDAASDATDSELEDETRAASDQEQDVILLLLFYRIEAVCMLAIKLLLNTLKKQAKALLPLVSLDK